MMRLTRWIPQDSTVTEHPLGVVYSYHARGPAAVAYAGKAAKSSWHHTFLNAESRTTKIQEFFASLEARQQTLANRKAERATPHTFQVGDIIVNSWGWEQTNIDFYGVVRCSDHFVWLQRLNESRDETGWLRGTSTPIAGTEHGPITQHAVQYGSSVNFNHGCGSKWDGKPEHWTAYA